MLDRTRLTEPMLAALRAAADRPRSSLCPTKGVSGGAQTPLIAGLWRRGLIWHDGHAFRINARGRALVEQIKCERG